MMSTRNRGSSLPVPTDRQIRAGVRWFAGIPPQLRRALVLALALATLLTGIFWLAAHNWSVRSALDALRGGSGPAVSTGFAGSGVETYSTAAEVLTTLTVADPSATSKYKRAAFGQPWEDIDHNGCDQRNDILSRDLSDVTTSERCFVLTGAFTDPYTGQFIDFMRGPKTSEAIPIDHVVALSNAWNSGASEWSAEQRVLFANDPLNLQAASQASNTEKSNRGADTWLPRPAYRCEYVARQISVKAAYQLTVTGAEKKAMAQALSACPDQPAYRSSFAGTSPSESRSPG